MNVIDEEVCKGCLFCVEECHRMVLQVSAKRNRKGYVLPEVVQPEKCVFCKKCEKICPDLAITIKEAD